MATRSKPDPRLQQPSDRLKRERQQQCAKVEGRNEESPAANCAAGHRTDAQHLAGVLSVCARAAGGPEIKSFNCGEGMKG